MEVEEGYVTIRIRILRGCLACYLLVAFQLGFLLSFLLFLSYFLSLQNGLRENNNFLIFKLLIV